MDLRKIDLRTKSRGVEASSEAATTELSDAQLSSVCGGKASPLLTKACARGTHFPDVIITF